MSEVPTEEVEEFGAYLRRMRQAAHMSLPELARRSGVSAAHLSRVESGWRSAPAARTVQRLAIALGIPPEEMLRKAGHIPSTASVPEGDVLAGVLLRAGKDLTPSQVEEIVEYMEMRKRQWARERKEAERVEGRGGTPNPTR